MDGKGKTIEESCPIWIQFGSSTPLQESCHWDAMRLPALNWAMLDDVTKTYSGCHPGMWQAWDREAAKLVMAFWG